MELLNIQSGRFALEVSLNEGDSTGCVEIFFRVPSNEKWIELAQYVTYLCTTELDEKTSEEMMRESIIKTAALATADMMRELNLLGASLAKKMGELYEQQDHAEG